MRVVIADCHAKVRSALRLILEQEPGFDVGGEAESAAELLSLATQLHPGLILLDWELPGEKPADLVRALRDAVPDLPIVALSGLPEACHQSLRADVNAFVSKNEAPDVLLRTLHELGDRPSSLAR